MLSLNPKKIAGKLKEKTAGAVKKSVEKTTSGAANIGYSIGRKAGWLGYTTLPLYTYFESKKSLENSDFSWYNPIDWIVKCLYSDEIQYGKDMNELSEKGMGIAAGLLVSKFILGSATERAAPKKHFERRISEVPLYSASAVAVNSIAESYDPSRETLENIVDSAGEIKNTFTSLENFTSSSYETFMNGIETFNNILVNSEAPLTENILQTAGTTLGLLGIYRLAEAVGDAFNQRPPLTNARDKYVEGKYINRLAKKEARKQGF